MRAPGQRRPDRCGRPTSGGRADAGAPPSGAAPIGHTGSSSLPSPSTWALFEDLDDFSADIAEKSSRSSRITRTSSQSRLGLPDCAEDCCGTSDTSGPRYRGGAGRLAARPAATPGWPRIPELQPSPAPVRRAGRRHRWRDGRFLSRQLRAAPAIAAMDTRETRDSARDIRDIAGAAAPAADHPTDE